MKKYIPMFIVSTLVLSGLGAVALDKEQTMNTIHETLYFSAPILGEKDQYITVDLNEATSHLMEIGKPSLPVVTKV